MNETIDARELIRLGNQAITSFLGQMIGDALGARYEFALMHFGRSPRDVIRSDQTSKGFLPMLGGGKFKVDPGQVTDDTEMALALLDSLLRNRQLVADDLVKSYRKWAASGPFDIGQNTRYIFTHPKNKRASDSRVLANRFDVESRERHGQDNLSNGAMMRLAPVGIMLAPMMHFAVKESGLIIATNLINLAATDTSLSHSSETASIASAVFLALVAGNIAHGRKGVDFTLEIANIVARQDPLVKQVYDRAVAGQPMSPPPTEKIGFLGTALHLALYRTIQVAREQLSFHRAMVATVELGGDTDTNAAIVGAAIGGLVELKEIPKEWVEAVLNSRDKPFMCRRHREFRPYGRFHLGQIQELVKIGLESYTYKPSRKMVTYGKYSYEPQ
jgi:ADP-ribosylglycohydrolase